MHTSRRGRPRPSLVPALAFTLALGFFFVPALAHAARGVVGPAILGVEWFTIPETPCNGQEVRLGFTVCECQVDMQYAGLDSTNGLLHIWLNVKPDILCVTCVPDTFIVGLGPHPAGSFVRTVRFEIEYETTPDLSWPPSPAYGTVAFDVAQRCGSPTGVAYLDRVIIGQPRRCYPCPPLVCPGDSIDVFLAGTFPDDCVWLQGISLVDPPYGNPLPAPPIVRIRYEKASCLDRACREGPIPWSARVRLPELPPLGGYQYQLAVEGYLRDICFSGDSLGLPAGAASFPFTVAESCSIQVPPGTCFNVAWRRASDIPVDDPLIGGCLATYSETHGAALVLAIGSNEAIAGVQGRLLLDSGPALGVQNLAALVPGWQVVQTPNPSGGVDFIAFAGPGGAPLPASPGRTPVPLLSLTVDPNRVDLPDQAQLSAIDLIVSDASGVGIPWCPVITLTVPPPNVAIVCKDTRACDANRDGATDVRDLVRMLQCLNPLADVRLACPGYDVLDCDRDADFDFDDVFCCARVMLGGFGGGPGDSLRRDAPEIAVGFGVPRPVGDGVLEVPLSLRGLGSVAAARIDVTYPDARYTFEGLTFPVSPPGWWTATHLVGGRIGLAMIGVGETTRPFAEHADAVLRLRLREGATAGGELVVAKHDFAAADGVALVTPHADGSVALSSIGQVALSPPRPNPFGAAFTCALTLPSEGAVDVAVFNSAGRRVATLMHESRAAAGVYTLGWNGVEAGGDRAAGGVYFLRVVAGEAQTSRKILFLPGSVR